MAKLTDKRVAGRYPFSYTPSAATDIRKTFARERKRLDDERKQAEVNAAEAARKVATIKVRK